MILLKRKNEMKGTYENYKYVVLTQCLTYNQAKYIKETLDGFVMQETSFPVVTVIMDDASTDGTGVVLQHYMQDNFRIDDKSVAFKRDTDYAYVEYAQHKTNRNCFFAVYYYKENLYQQGKHFLKEKDLREWVEQSKYVAFCEGDDYWTNHKKNQIQYDYLESHPNYSLVYGSCQYYYEERKQLSKELYGGSYVTFSDLIKYGNCIPTLTVMCRADEYLNYNINVKPEKKGWLMGDYPLWLWMSHEGNVHFLNEKLGVYRVLRNSASHFENLEAANRFLKSTCEIKKFFCNLFPGDSYFSEDSYSRGLFRNAVMYGDKAQAYDAFKKIHHHKITEYIKLFLVSNKWLYSLVGAKLFESIR